VELAHAKAKKSTTPCKYWFSEKAELKIVLSGLKKKPMS